jgi:hypothetical protein
MMRLPPAACDWQRFVVRYDTAFAAFRLLDDGRILWEPRDSRLPVMTTQGIEPPLRVGMLRREGAHAFTMLLAVIAGLFACEAVLLALAAWLAWRR